MNVECTSSCQAEPGDVLTAGDVVLWVATLPASAQLTPILREYGSQRDPVTTLGGIRAKWSEDR